MSDDEYYSPASVPSEQIEVGYNSDEPPLEKPKSKRSNRTQKQKEAFEKARLKRLENIRKKKEQENNSVHVKKTNANRKKKRL